MNPMADCTIISERERVIEAVTLLIVRTDQRDWPSVRAWFTNSVFYDMSSNGGGELAMTTAEQIVQGWA